MNQSIQFPDREEWDEAEKRVLFPAIVDGLLVECMISADVIIKRYGKAYCPLELFRQHRWDLEEEFETVILSGRDDKFGRYSLPSDCSANK
ncbi:DUF1488 domain-containing protein [Xenorhabdus nematophila]|uniref:DUF1488 domain-containing protein n=1 Tax=Xenorhabdus nematophila (strain ATCC 19061 / DSM 3370 / CCUG 14189 / LMG 1036 / NCIMB 9965 / AN6) TaxID=406817 RepID=D3VHU8_XENNA|nr:DUF1488 domain-containing protein [Xenorhabdus nematophila]CEE90019.1 conserved hypothetical protein [Xenorhabdus nematophila str. Anatoliense]CEF28818.1 conserved hypothetical protein [Xenorhabdus nematophila str. Websteri]AYA41427.1 DUF1488 domain-containing protein [Xenorhabdus nematophila]KHD27884.1 hypothetical protein LH67_14840 [Xenorhabdus nematophila]MBA0020165.1 DUF1488 domain-containing protein [Xenorhabdus nematophila]